MVSLLASKFYQRIRGYFRNELSAHLAVRHLDVALPSVLTTRYCIPQAWQIVLHQICSTTDPFDLRCESVTYKYILSVRCKDAALAILSMCLPITITIDAELLLKISILHNSCALSH